MRGTILAAAIAAALAISTGASAQSWATAQAAELTRQGREHEASGELGTAKQRFLDAIAFDPTLGAAYLALGELHEREGDANEAERTYSIGIDHVNGFADGLVARAKLRARQRRWRDAASDLEDAAALRPDDLALLRELASAYVAAADFPPALATTRRMAAMAEERGDASAALDAQASARALAAIVAGVDPVFAGRRGRGPVRSAIARAALDRAAKKTKARTAH